MAVAVWLSFTADINLDEITHHSSVWQLPYSKFHCICSLWPGAILVWLLLQQIQQTAIQIDFFFISMPNDVHVYYFSTCKPQNTAPVCCGFVTLRPGENRTFYMLLYAFSHVSTALHTFKYFSVHCTIF